MDTVSINEKPNEWSKIKKKLIKYRILSHKKAKQKLA